LKIEMMREFYFFPAPGIINDSVKPLFLEKLCLSYSFSCFG
jgi:hypothetical protein